MSQQSVSLPLYLANSLEPNKLTQHFALHPPKGFETFISPLGTPGFCMDFDLLTTVDERTSDLVASLPCAHLVHRLLTWRTVFFGSTVSEYFNSPNGIDNETLVDSMLKTWNRSSKLLIVKDIPDQSPLLSESERDSAAQLLEACKKAGFTLIAGQALAYVPIDFNDEADYLSRLSSSRRKNIRRKLRSRDKLRIELITSGCQQLNEARFLDELYDMYLEVYTQSDIHFDQLSAEFFAAVLRDQSLNGQLFLYYAEEKLIGFNLCFIHNNMLVDKYMGFRYPDARKHNLFFISWMENLAFCQSQRLTHYIAGWTDPEIKSFLGAKFTFTQHAVYLRNPVTRFVLSKFSKHFEHDKAWFEGQQH